MIEMFLRQIEHVVKHGLVWSLQLSSDQIECLLVHFPLFQWTMTIVVYFITRLLSHLDWIFPSNYEYKLILDAAWYCFVFFLAFDFCRFCVVIRCFHPRHNVQWPPIWPGTIFIMSFVWRRPWLGLNPGPPALDTGTVPLGYRGGGCLLLIYAYCFI